MATAQTTKTTQNAPAAPSAKQLRFLRTLAEQTAISFTPPSNAHQASGEIKRLLALRDAQDPAQARSDARRERHDIAAARRGDDAQIRPEETTGQGSSATWSSTPLPDEPAVTRTPAPQAGAATHAMRELGRYETLTGLTRLLLGQRVHGKVRVYDKPADGAPGRSYLVDRHVESHDELKALVADYLTRAAATGTCPMRFR